MIMPNKYIEIQDSYIYNAKLILDGIDTSIGIVDLYNKTMNKKMTFSKFYEILILMYMLGWIKKEGVLIAKN